MKTKTTENQDGAVEMIASLAGEIVSASRDLNNVLESGEVAYAFRTHYVDTKNDIHGIEQLIESILATRGAIAPRNAHETAMRDIVIGASLYFHEIESEVRKAFGRERYTDSTLRVYLAKKAKNIVNFQLTGMEDAERTSPKPRAKYYLVEVE